MPIGLKLRMSRCFGALVLLYAAAFVQAGQSEPEPNALTDAWSLAAQGRFTEAEAVRAEGAAPEEEDHFAKALLLFNRQPRTAGDLSTAIGLLSVLASEGSTPELRARSRYFWARAETLRTRAEPPSAALRLYEQLWREYPAQPYGQRALVHLLLMAFYADQPREAVLAEVARIEQEAPAITDPVVRSQFHQSAARGYLHLGKSEDRALEHLLKVSALGVARREAAGDLHVSIGQLATALGRPALAREHLRAFLQEFPNDPRVYTVKALLAGLPAE